MMKRLWRIVTVCLVVPLLCWHPRGFTGCTEPPPEAQSLSAHDIYPEEEPGDGSHHPKVHFQPPDDGLPTEGEAADEELMKWDSVADDEQLAEAQALEAEVLVEEAEPELANESEPEQGSQQEQLFPEASITQDQGPAPAFDPSPPPSGQASLTAQDSSPDTVSEQVEADIPSLDLNDADVNSAECDLTSVPVVLENTSNVHCGGTKSHVDPAQATPGLGQGNTSHMVEEQGLGSHVSAEMDPNTATKDPEDIPTFDEWKRKVMEVEERTLATHSSSSKASHLVKKPQKNFNNYASVECGAKILGANPEAKSTSAILMENMDLYMLNPCSNKIWFIIELCEPIQLKQLDIANFELFSSTPKDFLVSISDRYPTNKWLKLGTFHGLDERTVQSFPLDEHLYAKYVKMFTKYIKVELLSHFGSEHFCPFSLIRVFGTSMVEEYEEIADPSERADDQDDYFDYPPGYVLPEDKSSQNLIGSAKDVILNMVNNIAVSWGGPDNGNFTGQALNMTETSELDPTATLTPAPETVEEGGRPEILEDPDASVTEAPSPDLPIPSSPPPTEDSVTEAPEPELPPVDDQVITPLEEEEEEVEDYPSVVLLDREDGKEAEEDRERVERESLDYGGRLSTPSPSSSSCCCSASLQEYLLQRCSALPGAHRNHGQEEERRPQIPPHTHDHAPAREEPSAPAVTQERDPASGLTEPPLPPKDRDETGPEPLRLEPSHTPSSSSSSAPPSPSFSDPPASSAEAERPGHTPAPDPQALLESEAEEEFAPIVIITSSAAPVDRVWEPSAEEQPTRTDADPQESPAPTPAHPPEVAVPPSPPPPPLPTVPPPTELPAPPAELDSGPPEGSHANDEVTDPPKGHGVSTETKEEEFVDDLLLTSTNGSGELLQPSSSSPQSDFYAELQNTTEPAGANGNQVHGSSQKESVFMRLNNRIKALEINMSLSGRYLEQLSQRYRKQMEEMQRAFNKTIIKLQNTSRIAEEQDQRQTESIQTLHGQLRNITELVLNLSVKVVQLQSEVSDRQSYLLLCLVLGLVLGLLLCAQHCRMSALPPCSSDPEPPSANGYSYCFPDRAFSPYDEQSMKRSVSYPLLSSDPLQLLAAQGPESLHTVQPLRLSRKRKRGRTKPKEKVETLKSSAVVSAPPLANGAPLCNGAPRGLGMDPMASSGGAGHTPLRDCPSEGSSEGSSHSDEPSFCGIATCTRLCDGLPPPRTQPGKRASRRRHAKPAACVTSDLTHATRMSQGVAVPMLDRGGGELSAGTLGVKALSRPV